MDCSREDDYTPAAESYDRELSVPLDVHPAPVRLSLVLPLRVLASVARFRGGHSGELFLAGVPGPADEQKSFVARRVLDPLLRS